MVIAVKDSVITWVSQESESCCKKIQTIAAAAKGFAEP